MKRVEPGAVFLLSLPGKDQVTVEVTRVVDGFFGDADVRYKTVPDDGNMYGCSMDWFLKHAK